MSPVFSATCMNSCAVAMRPSGRRQNLYPVTSSTGSGGSKCSSDPSFRSSGQIIATTGTVISVIGGLAGGYFVSKVGLKRSLLFLSICLNVPHLCYVFLSHAVTPAGPLPLPLVYLLVCIEKFGYNFGFVGNMSAEEAAITATECGADLVLPLHYDAIKGNDADPADLVRHVRARNGAVSVLVPPRNQHILIGVPA